MIQLFMVGANFGNKKQLKPMIDSILEGRENDE